MPGPDLHLHSTASDGVLAPAALVELAARAGCPAIALTDAPLRSADHRAAIAVLGRGPIEVAVREA